MTLNKKLFSDKLPPCLVTLQRKSRALGYFWGRKFRSADGTIISDEIALNPAHFAQRGAKKVLSTLAHELCHQWQQHFGKPSSHGYHNAEWAAKMAEIGLLPSDTGRPGGMKTGPRMTHYIQHGGAFDRAADKLIANGFALAFVERTTKAERKIALKKRQSKTRYSCESCDLNAWAKPGTNLICGTCRQRLVPQSI
ncbi:MAG: SprT-like domain-containing protein [Afipia sp.]|nr:SprT-like domain-containing protein [Afipia sp.]